MSASKPGKSTALNDSDPKGGITSDLVKKLVGSSGKFDMNPFY
jgi:hypothetical protein